MSRFNDENTAQLARCAFQFRVDDSEEKQRKAKEAAPLLGKEPQLLAALQEAEQAYDEWIELAPVRNQVRLSMSTFPSDCKKIRNHLQGVLACWYGMKGYGGQYDLARRVPDLETRDDVSGFIRRIDEPLQQMLLGAQSGSEEVRFTYEGRPPGKAKSGASLTALEEFTKVLRAFWIREVSDTFGFNQTRVFDETTDAHKGRGRQPGCEVALGCRKDFGSTLQSWQC